MDRASQHAWMDQWRRAERVLAAQRRRDLRALTDEQVLTAIDALLSLATSLAPDARRLIDSGLIQQQALFHRRRR